MSDEEHSDSDGLDALASGLESHESEDADEELDLASLAAVVGARATAPAADPRPGDDSGEKVVLSSPGLVPAPAPEVPPPMPDTAAPPLAPRAARSWLVPALLACAIGVGAGGYFLGRSSRTDDAVQAAREQAPGPAAEPTVAAPPPPVTAPPPVAAPPPPAATAVLPPPAAAPAPAESAARPNVASAPRARVASAVAPAPREAEGAPEVAAPAGEAPPLKPGDAPAALAKTEPAPSRTMDDLLDDALAGRSRADEAAAPAALPEAPSREEVTEAMAVLLPAIRGCAMGQTGLATAGIVVRGDGRVASVELSGAPFEGTASGRCMEGVLRRARFARFRQPTFRVRFPFAIQ